MSDYKINDYDINKYILDKLHLVNDGLNTHLHASEDRPSKSHFNN